MYLLVVLISIIKLMEMNNPVGFFSSKKIEVVFSIRPTPCLKILKCKTHTFKHSWLNLRPMTNFSILLSDIMENFGLYPFREFLFGILYNQIFRIQVTSIDPIQKKRTLGQVFYLMFNVIFLYMRFC